MGLLQSRYYTGIEFYTNADGELRANEVLMKRKGNAFTVESSQLGLTLEALVANPHPTVLVLNIRGIVQRYFPKEDGVPSLQHILPNSNAADFYTQTTQQANRSSWLAVCRSEMAEQHLAFCESKGISVIFLGIGLPLVANLLAYTQHLEQIDVVNASLIIKEGQLTEIQAQDNMSTQQRINIGGENVEAKLLPAVAAILSSVLFPDTALGIQGERIAQMTTNWRYQQWYQRLWPIMLGVLGVSLLISYLVFNHYLYANAVTKAKILTRENLAQRADSLKADWEQSQHLMGAHQGGSRLSLYADRLAALMPMGISLNTLVINPEIPKGVQDPEDAPPQYQSDRLVMSGTTQNGNLLKDYKQAILQQAWVSDIQNQQFKNQADGTGFFEWVVLIRPTEN